MPGSPPPSHFVILFYDDRLPVREEEQVNSGMKALDKHVVQP